MKALMIVLGISYICIFIYTSIRILTDTHSTSKSLAYFILVLAFPVVGIIIYFSIGINYRHLASTFKGKKVQEEMDAAFPALVPDQTDLLISSSPKRLRQYHRLITFLKQIGGENLSENHFQLLINGEQKFPEVLDTLANAQHFIHMEYYDWENDLRGNQIKEVLLRKVKTGVKVRVLYDDYASRKIKRNIVKELKEGGAEVYPKIRVKLRKIANRMNHRDHRKVIIVDGHFGFVGGINVSDRYDNSIDTGLYWRDTHVKISGPLVYSLQRHFIVSWNSCGAPEISPTGDLFPEFTSEPQKGIPALAQIIAGGPIYPMSNIMLTYFHLFTIAREKLYITNPYFIPNDSILDALKESALSGVDVRIMLPEKSDSSLVGAASRFYFEELLEAGVKIFLYRKGFVHAKTVVADSFISVIGTANMDIRSFDLNFEIMSVIYGEEMGKQLEDVFLNDLKECVEVDMESWRENTFSRRLIYAIARLISSFL
ncbi:cardiolipin synthase [Algoriphagus kandeliae]|uniref:Cardiolipin synthase n=1 Tax=Algoriphagus kandeliae TaxID=2562278 RepID=A0A4Y9QUI5_9BACT|nr:cardiolipin synthase [Algoriphagus kandeliae]TFV95817.1 cardiolipin synthase [Algoriphagus kandeliae]